MMVILAFKVAHQEEDLEEAAEVEVGDAEVIIATEQIAKILA